MKLINYPINIEVKAYEDLVDKIIGIMSQNDDIISLYQMGSVKNPGISDLDIICVFKDGVSNHDNLRVTLNDDERLILTHGLFAVYESDFLEACRHNFISNLKLLYGKEFDFSDMQPIPTSYKTQIALEYLLKLHITLQIQYKLGVIKLRSFLLLAKAAIFDLELLDVKSGKFFESVQKVIELRNKWFAQPQDDKETKNIIEEYIKNLETFLEKILIEHKLYLSKSEFLMPGGIHLRKGKKLQFSSSGFFLPTFLSFLGNKYIKLQYKLSKFIFYVPYHIIEDDILKNKNEFALELAQRQQQNFPYYVALNSSLVLK